MSVQRVPTEIWRSILRHATHVPLYMDEEWDHDPKDHIWEGSGSVAIGLIMRAKMTVSRQTKLAILLVSRVWKELGIEFLYESIEIPGVYDKINRLLEVVRQSANGSYLGHGWWMKRIDCTLVGLRTFYNQVLGLLSLCHRIEIFSLSGKQPVRFSISNRLMEILHNRFHHSLRRLELFINETEHALSILESTPLLSLAARVDDLTAHLPLNPNFNTLTTLTIYMPKTIHSIPTEWRFPNLRSLSIDYFDYDDYPALTPFLE